MKRIISMMAMAMVLLWSCQEKDNLGVAASGEVAIAGDVVDGQILVGPEGGEFTVGVTSSEGWRVAGLADWVTVSSEAGNSGQSVTFTVLPNDKEVARTATFKIFSADAVEAVTIMQSPLYTISLVSESEVSLSSDASQITVSLLSNVEDLEVDFDGAEEWIKLTNVADAFGKKLVQFDVVRSSEFKAREAVLTIGSSVTDEVATVAVTQAQRDTAFVVGEQRIVKGLDALSLNLVLKSNVDVTYSLPSWLIGTIGEPSEMDETGLRSQTVTLSAEACGGSRAATISFKKSSTVVGSLFVKQQNPNPVFTTIPDENLRYYLESNGWIVVEEGSKCELIEAGISGTSLVIGSTSASKSSADPIKSIEGVENFPNLESLTLGSVQVAKVDVSNFPKLNTLRLINMNYITEINTGSRPITSLTNEFGTYTYTTVKEIVVKGENIESINFNVIDNYYVDYEGYYGYFESFDVTECPKLTTLKVKRSNSWGESSLKYIYMTAAQAASVEVEKLDKTEIVVK